MQRLTKRGALPDRLPWIAAGIAALIAAMGAVFVFGMRTKSPLIQKAVRRVNRAYTNPRAMETAGTPGAYASVIHHVGRRSGTTYHTPVVPIEIGGGFAIALPYGERADWVQNVLAAGQASLTVEGTTYEVDQPEVTPIDAIDRYFEKSDRAAHRIMKVETCLRLNAVESDVGDSIDMPYDRVHTPAM